MYKAILNSDLKKIKLLIKQGENVNSEIDNNNSSPLHLAVKNKKNPEIVKCLLKHGANVNQFDDYEKTPLDGACELHNNVEIVEILLQHGADVNASNGFQVTPLHRAAQQENNTKVIKLLIDYGANLHVKDKWNDFTPFHLCIDAQKGTENAALLLEHGSDLYTRDECNSNVLDTAVRKRNNTKMIQFLLNQGMDANAKGSALLSAVMTSQNAENIKLLFNHGADVHVKSETGNTILHKFIQKSASTVDNLRLLLKYGADINSLNHKGETPLFLAVYRGKHFHVNAMLNNCDRVYCNFGLIAKLNQLPLNRRGFDKSLNFLVRHLIRLKVLNLLEPEIFESLKLIVEPFLNDWTEFQAICEAEANLMRTQWICENRTVTCADLLTKGIRKVATYLSVYEMKQRLSKVYCNKTFPNYGNMLNYRVQKGKDLAKLLNGAYDFLQAFLGKRLPRTFLITILDYLEEKDLKNLKVQD